MYQKVWKHCQPAICALNFYSAKGIRFDSVTGFKYGRYLLTDDRVYKIEKINEVQIAFYESDGVSIKASVKITEKDFKLRMVQGIRDGHAGFALVDIDLPQFDDIPSLKLSTSKSIDVGSSIAIIGHQTDNNNVAIKPGIVSSYVKQNSRKYIQFDAALDRGNSGCPLINAETGEVVGIVGHRLSNITDSYKQMIQVINKNLVILKDSEGKINLNDIDPIQVLIANQNQIKRLAQEFFKTSSLMYGFAMDIEEVSEFFDIAELEKDRERELVPVTFRQN